MPELGEDITLWGREHDGKFRLCSAYRAAADWLKDESEEEDRIDAGHDWKQIWTWSGPNRIRHFLWLAFHNRLMTNSERKRMKLCTDDKCDVCKLTPETAKHIIRECPEAKKVWQQLEIVDTPLTRGLNFAC
ncbi:unnamed protein product [Linum trigynum]|uniref:Reverse transcriptase zinc-binding domain-containing protein n=1 Tax=Linum trigynum TaxID=586398 RepID=A0AAV2CEQ3_9ROSI